MKYFKHRVLLDSLVLIAFAALILFLVCTCSLNKPEKTIVLNLAAQNSGFLLAQERPGLIKDVLEYSKYALEVLQPEGYTEAVFHRWAEGVIKMLKLNPLLEMNFKEMVKLVKVEILLTENQQEISQLVYSIMQHFLKGIRAGKK